MQTRCSNKAFKSFPSCGTVESYDALRAMTCCGPDWVWGRPLTNSQLHAIFRECRSAGSNALGAGAAAKVYPSRAHRTPGTLLRMTPLSLASSPQSTSYGKGLASVIFSMAF